MSNNPQPFSVVSDPSRNDDEFERLISPYRHELLVHCCRMLGSFEESEDALQETLIRAWRHLDSLKAQSLLRAWLYKITTNVCLDMLDSRKARLMPETESAPADPVDPLPAPEPDIFWIEPLPDEYLAGYESSPESRYEVHESVNLAFLAVLQHLTARQRAVLIMRDVLGWKAQEVADLLELTVAAVNSALQRARVTMKKSWHKPPTPAADDHRIATLLARYIQAWESADLSTIVALLREDAILTMPPLTVWYRGSQAIHDFFARHIFNDQAPSHFRLRVTRANGCPALAVYQSDSAGVYRPAALQIFMINDDQIARIDDYLVVDNRLFARFNLPLFG